MANPLLFLDATGLTTEGTMRIELDYDNGNDDNGNPKDLIWSSMATIYWYPDPTLNQRPQTCGCNKVQIFQAVRTLTKYENRPDDTSRWPWHDDTSSLPGLIDAGGVVDWVNGAGILTLDDSKGEIHRSGDFARSTDQPGRG